jgi:DNA-directed RNA polymerase subunit F
MFDDLIAIGQQLGIFEYLKNKLIARPDEATKALSGVLEELSKTFTAIDGELINYLSIWFDKNDPKEITEQRKKLIELEGGGARVRIANAVGHCHTIKSIYDRYINTWLSRLEPEHHNELKRIFATLCQADFNFVGATDQLAVWLQEHASMTLKVMSDKDPQSANQLIDEHRKEIGETRKELSKITVELYKMNGEITSATKALNV